MGWPLLLCMSYMHTLLLLLVVVVVVMVAGVAGVLLLLVLLLPGIPAPRRRHFTCIQPSTRCKAWLLILARLCSTARRCFQGRLGRLCSCGGSCGCSFGPAKLQEALHGCPRGSPLLHKLGC
jgi:hypothetical protein